MTKQISMKKKIMVFDIIARIKVIENRVFFTIDGLPLQAKPVMMAQMETMLKKSRQKGEIKPEQADNIKLVGDYIIIEEDKAQFVGKTIPEMEDNLLNRSKILFEKQGFKEI
jgi:hypothetical protein